MREFEAKQIGERIALARKEAGGMTQEELAELVGVSQRSVQLWEAGSTIPYKRLGKIAEVLGRPVWWFIHGEDQDEDERLARMEGQIREALTILHDLEARQPGEEPPPEAPESP